MLLPPPGGIVIIRVFVDLLVGLFVPYRRIAQSTLGGTTLLPEKYV